MNQVVTLGAGDYCHVQNVDTGVERLLEGPVRYTCRDEEKLVVGKSNHIVVERDECVLVKNPVVDGTVVPHVLKWDHYEYRFWEKGPFPLYPGETLVRREKLRVLRRGEFAWVRVVQPYTAEGGVRREPEDVYLLEGPTTYVPRVEEVLCVEAVQVLVLGRGQGAHLCAREAFVDAGGVQRRAGERWLVPGPGRLVVDYRCVPSKTRVVDAIVIPYDHAATATATESFVDDGGVQRRAGESWLVTYVDTDMYLPPPQVGVSSPSPRVHLGPTQYCYVEVWRPAEDDSGTTIVAQELRQGPQSFFETPTEVVRKGPLEADNLGVDESLLVRALADHTTTRGRAVRAGEVWLEDGPQLYVPPPTVVKVERRRAVPLSETEGLYVKDLRTGAVRLEMGRQSFRLRSHEVLWEKSLDEEVEELLRNGGGMGDPDIRKLQYFSDSITSGDRRPRDRTRAVTYMVPAKAAVRVTDSKSRGSRVLFGPALAVLGPFEEFTVLRYSAGKPKRPGALTSLCLLLGPDYITDIFEVETVDHARLRIRLAVNSYFRFDRDDADQVNSLFSVPDFIGGACKVIASRIRARVAATGFEEFHRGSARIISDAIFGEGKSTLFMPANRLVLDSVDIKTVEIADEKTRSMLSRTILQAIETSTRGMERKAEEETDRLAQEAKGLSEITRLRSEIAAEDAKNRLAQVKTDNYAVSAVGASRAKAQAYADVLRIEGETEVARAQFQTTAADTITNSEQKLQERRLQMEMEFRRREQQLELEMEASRASIEASRFTAQVGALSPALIQSIALAEPAHQAALLQGLGIETVVFQSGGSGAGAVALKAMSEDLALAMDQK